MLRQVSRPWVARLALAFAVVLMGAAVLPAGNWPQWRGPKFNGIAADAQHLPTKWGEGGNVAWRLPLPGKSGATPAVWGDRVFVTAADDETLLLLCISTDGKELWRRTVGTGDREVMRGEGNMASPSPVTDGRHVWVMMGTGDLACYDFDGKEVWTTNLQERFGKFNIQFGMHSTPVLHGGRLFVQLIHGEGRAETQEALVAALDAATGETVWRRDRVTGAYAENEHSYASPILYDFGGRQYLITHGADHSIAHKLDDGSEIWRINVNPQDNPKQQYHKTLRFVSSPGISPDLIVIPTAKERPTFAIRPDARGTITTSSDAFVWQYPQTPDVPSPLIHDGLVYLCMARSGILHCLDAKTGEPLYEKRFHGALHRASPVLADGKLYLTARDGMVTVVQPGREFKILAQNDLGEDITASPAIADDTIYLRTWDALWAIRQK